MIDRRPRDGALSQFTVLEATVARAGPFAGRQLADWGADVIKIEQPRDAANPEGRGSMGSRYGSDFQNLHRNRRSLTLDLKNPAGVETLARLAEKADVLIENFRPDVKHRLGIDYDSLAKRNPRLVYASISGFGEDGPYGVRAGVDQIAQGMGGLMSITGEPGGKPMRVGMAIADVCSGLMAAFGILTALHERAVSGKGQWIRTSLLQTQIFMLDFQAARWLQDGDIPSAVGNDHPTIRPQGLFRASDGYFNIATVPPMWAKFCHAMGLNHIEKDPLFAAPKARVANSARLSEAIEEVTITQPMAVWIEKLNAIGIPCGPVYRMDQVFDDPQVRHLGVAQTVTSPALGDIRQVRQPLDFSRTPSALWGAAPEHGENSSEILQQFGFTPDEVEELKAQRAI
jgi:crotonobetainyl-CoA:carnitine CoA-transferase CaiB-like acyl-CoA transferase